MSISKYNIMEGENLRGARTPVLNSLSTQMISHRLSGSKMGMAVS